MTKEEFEAFQEAWLDYPTQDNEGYTPDRGSFKAGWFAALRWNDVQVKEGFLENLSNIRKENIAFKKRITELESGIDYSRDIYPTMVRLKVECLKKQELIEELSQLLSLADDICSHYQWGTGDMKPKLKARRDKYTEEREKVE